VVEFSVNETLITLISSGNAKFYMKRESFKSGQNSLKSAKLNVTKITNEFYIARKME